VFPQGSVWQEPGRPYFYLEVRFLNDENGALSPRYFMGFTLREVPLGQNATYSHLFSTGISPLLDLWAADPQPGSPTHVGAYIPMSSLPAFAKPLTELEATPGPAAVAYTDTGT
jgi:hypothetical protein